MEMALGIIRIWFRVRMQRLYFLAASVVASSGDVAAYMYNAISES